MRYAWSHCRPLKLAAVSKVMPTAKVSLWRAFLTLLVWHAGGLDGEFVKLFRQKTAIGENVYTLENLALYDMHIQSEMYLTTSLKRIAIGVVTCAMHTLPVALLRHSQ